MLIEVPDQVSEIHSTNKNMRSPQQLKNGQGELLTHDRNELFQNPGQMGSIVQTALGWSGIVYHQTNPGGEVWTIFSPGKKIKLPANLKFDQTSGREQNAHRLDLLIERPRIILPMLSMVEVRMQREPLHHRKSTFSYHPQRLHQAAESHLP